MCLEQAHRTSPVSIPERARSAPGAGRSRAAGKEYPRSVPLASVDCWMCVLVRRALVDYCVRSLWVVGSSRFLLSRIVVCVSPGRNQMPVFHRVVVAACCINRVLRKTARRNRVRLMESVGNRFHQSHTILARHVAQNLQHAQHCCSARMAEGINTAAFATAAAPELGRGTGADGAGAGVAGGRPVERSPGGYAGCML